VQVALIADDGSEPGDTDWMAATWASNGVAKIKVLKGQYPASSLFAWVMFDTTDEAPVIPSGRIRVGNGDS
jgi:hypothetical protein